jgi:transcriptional regulator with GAF, ATPase, and Fis domain
MPFNVWIHDHGPCDAIYVRTITAALDRSGVVWVPPGEPGAVGVVLFNQPSSELGAYVQRASRSGLERVVAVAASEAHVSGALAWPLRRAGASDVIAGIDVGPTVKALLCRATRWTEIDALMSSPSVAETLIGCSPAWVQVLREVVEAAAFTDGSILLLGESGTGKELIARMVHDLDRRRGKKSLVVLDCTTVVPELSGSEFFGHERGAFTGASTARDGCFALADGGTLFLDELGELPLPLQAQLLRVIQERTYKRVGSNEWMRANFRLVAATNRALDAECDGNGFRSDLFHRIASRVFHIPPLRQRTEDVLPLATHFFSQMRPAQPAVLDAAVREYLLSRAYPGNIRELRQLICRMNDRWVGDGPVTVGTLPVDDMPRESDTCDWRSGAFDQAIWKALEFGVGLQDIKEAVSRRACALALQMAAGSTRAAAQRLAVTERTVQNYRAERRLLAGPARDVETLPAINDMT